MNPQLMLLRKKSSAKIETSTLILCIAALLGISASVFFILSSSHDALNEIPLENILAYEDNFIADYQKNLKETKSTVKWIQAAQRFETCKIYYAFAEGEEDYSKRPEFRIYWDGQCKNGRPLGLGREFMRARDVNVESIGVYPDQGEPVYYMIRNNITGSNWLGEFTPQRFAAVMTEPRTTYTVNKDDQLQITYTSNSYNGNDEYVERMKEYPNFYYMIHEDDNEVTYEIMTNSSNDSREGYQIRENKKTHETISHELQNGFEQRRVIMPEVYMDHLKNIDLEILRHVNTAMRKSREAETVVQSYLRNVCNGNHNPLEDILPTYRDICVELRKNPLERRISRQ